ncbi:MAG: ornithine carbamoyltransferase [Phycisphaerales bacterium]
MMMNLAALSTTDFLTIRETPRADLEGLLATALACKARPADYATALAGRSVVMLFEKPSLRTRMSFEVGVFRLGGQAIYYDHGAGRIGQRESTADYARNLERWVAAIVARTFSQKTLVDLAEHARVPVINALSDSDHPCQALADVLTLTERFGSVRGLRVAYVGDGNNVCVSLMQAVTLLGGHMVVVTPPAFGVARDLLKEAGRFAAACGGSLTVSTDPAAVAGARAVYTDTWVSMHQEHEAEKREKMFVPYRVTSGLMAAAARDAVFMHCLPAHRGEEVTAEVIDSERSVVFDQAENRMHAQNAVLLHLLCGRTGEGREAGPGASTLETVTKRVRRRTKRPGGSAVGGRLRG